jgi:hypothetical protein
MGGDRKEHEDNYGSDERNVTVGVARSPFNSSNVIDLWWFVAKRAINGQFSSPMVKKSCLTVRNWFTFIYYKGNDRQKSIWPRISGQEAIKGVNIGVALKFDSRIKS